MPIVRVQCKKCGWWVEVDNEGVIKQCWKCLSEVRFTHSGTKIVGKSKPFMTFEWQDTKITVIAK